MSLWLHAHGAYPSYADMGLSWRGVDHDAHMFVQTLKGNSINGYVNMRDASGKVHRITTNDPSPAFAIFGEWGAKSIAAQGLNHGVIVAVPASSCVSLGADEKGRKLAKSIADRMPGFEVWEPLHWHKALTKAADGGPRDFETLLSNLRVLTPASAKQMVLVDDVVSTGGHLKACATALRFFGHTVDHALTAAQTVWNYPSRGMFDIPSRDLEDNAH
jgi:hypothetical protein